MADERTLNVAIQEMIREGIELRNWWGWAHRDHLEEALAVTVLRRKVREREEALGVRDPKQASQLTDEQRLRILEMRAYYATYLWNQRRQRSVCEALGLPWPPDTAAHPTPPWTWGWVRWSELWAEGHRPIYRPVVYASDWDVERDGPDAWGYGERWTRGEVLVVTVEELERQHPHGFRAVAPALTPAATASENSGNRRRRARDRVGEVQEPLPAAPASAPSAGVDDRPPVVNIPPKPGVPGLIIRRARP